MNDSSGSRPIYVDAHVHLDEYPDTWLGAVLQQLEEDQIVSISTAMAPQAYQRSLEIQQRSPWVCATIGVHPWNARHFSDTLDTIEPLLSDSPMFGEIGLDFRNVRDRSMYAAQVKVLEFFLSAAKRQDKIINVHTSGAETEVMDMLERFEIRRAIVHWYSGPLDPLKRMVMRGYMFTFGCEVLSSGLIQSLAHETPLDQILTETDNPGGPQWVFGEPAMPELVKPVVQALAIVKGIDEAEARERVRRNMISLVGDDARLSGVRHALDGSPGRYFTD